MKADQERVSKLLTDTVTLLCKNGLIYSQEIKVQGLLGITLDKNDVFIVHIDETIGGGTGKESSAGEGSRRKMATASQGGNTNYVDLTRLADTPMVSLNNMQEMSMMQGGRKQRPSSMMPPQMTPHMMPRGGGGMQYMNPGMHTGRMRMGNAAMHSGVAQQMGGHMMYTQRGGGQPMMMPPNMRGYTGGRGGGMGSRPRHTVQMIPSSVVAVNDDEDVMIVGTGHEDPNWKNNAMRRPPNLQPQAQPRRRMVHPHTGSRQQLNVPPGLSSSAAVRNQSTPNGLGASMSNNKNMGGQIIVEDNASPPTQIIIQPSESAADRGVEGDDPAGSSGAYQPEFVLLNSIGGVSFDGGVEDGLNGETGTRKEMDGRRSDEPRPTMIYANIGGGSGAAGDSSSVLPVVYTDIADPPTTSSLSSSHDDSIDMNIETPGFETPGFDILTADDDNDSSAQFPTDGGFDTWTCRFSGCTSTYTSASHLANHYTLQHSSTLDLAPPPGTVVPPRPTRPSSSLSGSSSQQGSVCAETERNVKRHQSSRHKEIGCPFGGCAAFFSSYPGLYMHHKRVHGIPVSKEVRRALRKRFGVQGIRCGVRAAVLSTSDDVSQPGTVEKSDSSSPARNECDENNVEDGANDNREAGGGSPTKNFLCLFSQCEVSCTSREKLVEHLQSCHGSMDAMVAEVEMKEENESRD